MRVVRELRNTGTYIYIVYDGSALRSFVSEHDARQFAQNLDSVGYSEEVDMPSDRSLSEQNADLLNSLFGSAPSVPPVSPTGRNPSPPPRRQRVTRAARATATAASVATAMSAASANAIMPQAPETHETDIAGYVGDVTGMEQREVRAIELCARKMELLALQSAVERELEDLNRELNRLKRNV